MKKLVFILAAIITVAFFSCKKKVTPVPADPHVANADCASCHATEQAQWASAADFHAFSAAEVLTDANHDTEELLIDDCLKCHSTFQFPLGVAHFVTPVDQVGSPAGTWTALNASDWQATKCEVCHDPTATNTAKLAKYGSMLDGAWSASYTNVADMPDAYQKILSSNGDTSTYVFPDQTKLSVQATKLCLSCHDPADQGADPAITQDGINYGPQGGDSRSYVMSNHQGFGCTDCHNPHDFTPVNPVLTTACVGCHPTADSHTGVVHINHL